MIDCRQIDVDKRSCLKIYIFMCSCYWMDDDFVRSHQSHCVTAS